MSKSKGNIIDPLKVMDKYGTDAFRFTLAAFAAHGRDIKLSEERVEGYRHFANKLWNASRFTLMNISNHNAQPATGNLKPAFFLADRWILSRLNTTVKNVRKSLEEYRFNDAAEAIYQFVWHELCDWYIEIIKPRLYGKEAGRESAGEMLILTLGTSLRLLHPFMPFITEEIWERVKLLGVSPSGGSGSILLEPYPLPSTELIDSQAEEEMKILIDVVAAVRSLRGEMNTPPAKKVDLILKTGNQKKKQIIGEQRKWITQLAGLQKLEFREQGDKPENAAVTVVDDIEILVLADSLMNSNEEKARLRKEIKKIQEELNFIEKKLSNHNFVNKAPKEVVEKNKERQKTLKEKISKLTSMMHTTTIHS